MTSPYDFSHDDKVKMMMEECGCSADKARAYLEAEEWILYEAIYSYKADNVWQCKF